MVGEFTVTVGIGLTVSTEVFVPLQLLAVPVTVYVTDVVAVLVTVDPVVALKPVAGLHVYVEAPPAVKVAVLPAHIVGEFTVTVGVGLTVTVVVLTPEQTPVVPVTVYTVVAVGLAVTLVPEVPLRPVPGDQLYVVPPDAVKVELEPAQIVAELTVTVGVGVTLTVIEVDPVHPLAVPLTI
jgi:hypothetical protein